MSHEPLSRSLERLSSDEGITTLNELVNRTEGRGIFLVMILLCLPFVTPVPMPGFSNVIGLALLIVSIRLYFNLPARLPRILGGRPWPAARMQKVIRGSLRLLNWLERWVRPRQAVWLTRRWAVRLNAALLALMAAVLALPVPPVMPFSNGLPSCAIILLSAAMMEEDGATIWLGYAAVIATLSYFVLFFGILIRLFTTYEERILNLFRAVP